MANITRNFIKGRMNKSVDERLVPDGEYIDAINVRMGSTENAEIGVIENAKGNLPLTSLQYGGVPLSSNAKCIGAFEDGSNETIYWFVHDSNYPVSAGAPTGKLDLIVSFDAQDGIINYHVVSVNDGSNLDTTINFDPKYLITGVNKVSDLLFFTDNKNDPRFINVKDSFLNPNVAGSDYGGNPTLLSERLLVIKRPPLYAPTVDLFNVAGIETNYLEERYICFAYRYRYSDGDYSATSPFTEPAFVPDIFEFSTNSLLNEGMANRYNSANVGYNTGGPLVKSIELLFKNAQDSTIKVIDKFVKKDRGFSDNSNQTYLFSNSNIFTILPVSEILRLYDNVPRFALGQTTMGNRLIYGNYIDGYNLQRNGSDTQIEYTVDLISENISEETVIGNDSNVTYTIPTRSITETSSGEAEFDLSSFVTKLKKGSILTFNMSFSHNSFAPAANPQPTSQTSNIDISFTFKLVRDYTSVYDLGTSDGFINTVGNNSPRNINPVYTPSGDDSCDGVTFTDEFNCSIPSSLPSGVASGFVKKFSSAISGASLVGATGYDSNEPIEITVFPIGSSLNTVILKLPYMRFVNDVNAGGDTTEDIYEFYDVTYVSATLQSTDSNGSLHSNRGYETGIVYMDDFGRSSTALVSANNSLQVPCSASLNKNKIQVTIPTRQIGPEWATYYKFVIKPDEENYEIIYSNIYYRTTDANYAYFLLEGENSRKVEEGDRLIIKKDSGGSTTSCVYVTILEKKSFAAADIEPSSLAGTYMKVGTNQLNLAEQENSTILYGLERAENNNSTGYGKMMSYNSSQSFNPGIYPVVTYPMSITDSSGNFYDYDVPSGSRVAISFNFYRNGRSFPASCGEITMVLSVWMQASRDYVDMFDFLVGENFQGELDNAIFSDPNNKNIFYQSKLPYNINPYTNNPVKTGLAQNVFWWTEGNGTTVPSFLSMTGTLQCGNGNLNGQESVVNATFEVNRSDGVVIFETEPQDALPDVWFESADTYTIDADGYHSGNVQPQNAFQPAIINTDFYNCFSFGNGVESYKIRDSIVGKTFNLGNRILTTSEKEYREAHRYADLTYSGVYNEENNVNKLNEFNLGLLNFKPLEQSFGPIQKLFGRDTDILTLQEDRISYVLQGKNLLSDAGAGSALTSVPEVLGTQIARIEEYGISSNPESFVQWGASKYFTDAKRGAVIQLKGTSAQNEDLSVISEQGMRSWFRDLFIDSFGTQKLGGYDPYMGEYVISSNNTLKPVDEQCINCDTTVGQLVVDDLNPYNFCVDVGDLVGDLSIVIGIEPSVVDNSPFDITYTYAGVTTVYTSNNPPLSDIILINKSSVADQKISIVISKAVDPDPTSYIELINVGCPVADIITIVPISITSNANSGEYIHSEYSWTDGSFVSPLHSRLVEFKSDAVSNPIVSDYDSIVGPQGAGVIPADGATVSLVCNKINFDDFVFNKNTNNFRYFRSNIVYDETVDADMQALLLASTTVTPIDDTFQPTKYSASFTMPSTGTYLYLIWDYRLSTEDDLCFGATLMDSCCNC